MPRRKKNTDCLPKPPKPFGIKQTDCRDVADIIDALQYEVEACKAKKEKRKAVAATKQLLKYPHFKKKPFKPPHFKDTCVPMAPSMHTRLRYLGHCAPTPPSQVCRPPVRNDKLYFPSSEEDEIILPGSPLKGKHASPSYKKYSAKKVRRIEPKPGDIVMTSPEPVVRHSASDKSILNVPSPKTSGEIISAQKAPAKPEDMVPPLPPAAAKQLYKPHSGIVLNRDADFVPAVVNVPGKLLRQERIARKKKREDKKKKALAKLRRRGLLASLRRPGSKAKQKKSKKLRLADVDVCGVDDIPPQEQVGIPRFKRGALQTHSLTIVPCTKKRKPELPYGILQGSFNMYNNKFGARSRGRQQLPVIVMAYCLAFHYHPKQWTTKLVDNLVDAGDQWYLQCLDKVHDHSAYMGICEVLPFAKKQILLLNKKRMQVLLGEPEIVGYTMTSDPTVYNLSRGLTAFFQVNRAGVMLSRVLKVIIWKDKVCYYIFDPAGRDSKGYSNFTDGRAALLNVKDLTAVTEFLLGRSILEDQKFILAPVKVLKMVDEKVDDDLESEELTEAQKAMMGYTILSDNCAVVTGGLHLGDRCFEEAKYRQALPIAIVAMSYAKISPPNTWFSRTVDKILRLGNKLYLDCVQPKVVTDLTIDNIPNVIPVGPFTTEIMINRERVKGQLFTKKECMLNINNGLREFFSHGYTCGIIEFYNNYIAVWRQKDMFYMFDPYPRTPDGMRALQGGKACVMMYLNTDGVADAFTRIWDYMPPTTLFHIHAFKVLKLRKKQNKLQIQCTLSDEHVHDKAKKKVLGTSRAHGDGRSEVSIGKPSVGAFVPGGSKSEANVGPGEDEAMPDIISLVDSIGEEFVPRVPARFKTAVEEPYVPKVVNLDSPTVSVTQIVPAWPVPRDKTNEPPEPDPEREPTPPPTPPPPPVPEGGAEEEEEAVEEEEDEESMARKKEEALRKQEEEEEARRKAEELPPPMPPPPSPQPEEAEVELAEHEPDDGMELEILEIQEPSQVNRAVLLAEDAKYRSKLRQIRKKITSPLVEPEFTDNKVTPETEMTKPSNFKNLPDHSQIIRGAVVLTDPSTGTEILPFGAITAIITSYKYSINTWTPDIVNFVVNTAKQLYSNKQSKFQTAPVHIIPKIGLGHQSYHASIDVIGEGASWQLKHVLENKLFTKYDRGMVTTPLYSCAIFKRNGLYYLFDGSPCNAMGLRNTETQTKNSTGKACFLRFDSLEGLASRILYNKDGPHDDQQFILSRVVVRRLLKEPRSQLPEDYNFETASGKKSSKVVADAAKKKEGSAATPVSDKPVVGYQLVNGVYRIEGTTAIKDGRKPGANIKSCHFVCLMAMLMATMHPVRTWDHFLIDTCIEKGLEINKKAINFNDCEKRIIKNVILDGKIININIKKLIVINENPERTIEQYLKAVMQRLRYVIIKYPQCSLVITQADGFYHLFDPYPAPEEDAKTKEEETQTGGSKPSKKGSDVASWTLYRSLEAVIRRLKKVIPVKTVDNPEFYTFELTSVKYAPRYAAIDYKLSAIFRPDENPNLPYLKRKKIRPIVDEKMYWLNIEFVPWSRMSALNDLGLERKTAKTMWHNWDIETPGDLFSLWGTIHPKDSKFTDYRGQQYLAVCAVAVGMVKAINLSAWTSRIIDGVVNGGNDYHIACVKKVGGKKNHEIEVTDLDATFEMFPFQFAFKYEEVIFGFVYSMLPDRFNLSKALTYFFERFQTGIITSPAKNLAFGKVGSSYFMFDGQSFGAPIHSPSQGVAYILKCESINRLIYCMTITLNIRSHGQQFHLYSVDATVTEK